jgi:phage shock protein PspC (stress-responsive transcriptional regulator)
MMKDITRIHIAKVPYNIELSAKKHLEKYINALELYTGDWEVLEDIEIRITELLLERGVKQESVISEADVKAVREQLGEPKDFLSDDATDTIDPEALSEIGSRKLYRNLENAVLGGVLSGVASYFRINAFWVRLGFILLSFISFGLFILLYIVAWLIIPPARTAAEKLQMAGRPVTLTSIRELNEAGSGIDNEKRVRILKRIATTVVGVGGIVGALTSIALMVAFVLRLVGGGDHISGIDSLAPYQITIILGFAAGTLLTILFLLVAIAAFAQKFNKRIWISGIIIVVLGLSSFGAAVISGAYQQQLQYEEVQRNTVDTSIKLPDNFSSVTSLSVDVPDMANVVYVADDSVTSIKERALKGAPQADVTVENGVVKLKLAQSNQKNTITGTTITIYGPRLDGIIVSNGYASYSSASQANLKAEVYNASSLRLIGSRIDTLTLRTDGTARLSADEAAVAAVTALIYGQSSVNLGNIKTLAVTNPDVCASNETAQLSVGNIVSASYTHNGIGASAQSVESPCLSIRFNGGQGIVSGYQD